MLNSAKQPFDIFASTRQPLKLSDIGYNRIVSTEPPVHRKPHHFVKDALQHLSFSDQILFGLFGQGEIVELPYDNIHHAFEAQVLAQPQAIAAEHLGEAITYTELNRQATRLATRLAALGVKSGDNVTLFLNRSIPMLVGILASLKVGAAYVPQHAKSAPEAQLRHIQNVTSAKVTLTLSNLCHLMPENDDHTYLAIDEIMKESLEKEAWQIATFAPAPTISGDNACYILFTSGTTGSPNGVQVTHRNVCNILLTAPGDLGVRSGMKVAQILNIGFDMAAWEIFVALTHGATLVIRGKDIEETVRKADVVIATPTVLASFDADQCHNIKIAAVAGEPCPVPLADTWSSFATFYNSCGPTETTIVNTVQKYESADDALTIGRPTPNNTVYVLNEDMKPCAIGDVGEMWAGGLCVSAGYLQNPILNAERYKPDPFLGEGHKMFRTRDLGRWTFNGELEHFGRTDDQVKVRGFRVELNSVSAVIESIPEVHHAVTLKLDDRNLVAFVSSKTVGSDIVKQAISAKLPYYYVPAMVLTMADLPMTSRGKADKKVLMSMALKQQEKLAKAQPELVKEQA